MGWDEIRVRTRQALSKRSDLAKYRLGISPVPKDGIFSPKSSGRFFFEKRELPGILACLRESFPDVVEQIVDRAERICRHRFDLLGYEAVSYGPEIDWHLDAVNGKRAPLQPWFRIPYLNFDQVGDAKVIWELNRHQHMVTLAKAYRLTENDRYAQELFHEWYDWRRQNPYPLGINWASSLEVAFRSLSWLWVWNLLEDCPIVPPEFPFDLRKALILSARHVERFLSTYFSPNTHLLGEGVGLFFAGIMCPYARSAPRWQARGWQIILQAAERQVRPDGMYFEQSTYYHTYALDFFLHSRILASLNQTPIPTSFDQTIQEMLEVTGKLNSAGHLPQFGDDDGGRVFDPGRNRERHMHDPLIIGSVLYDRPDLKREAGPASEELLWLLGPKGVQRFIKLPDREPTSGSFVLSSSGIYVMRGADPASYQLVIDAGPQGAGRSGHGHADALSVQLSANGKPLLIDPGTFTYAGSSGERDWFRGTAAHNTVQVDESSQAEPTGPFEWRGRADATANWWVNGKTFDLFCGSHSGYSRPFSPTQHRRYIFYLKSRFWLIRDVVGGTGLHGLSISWHFAPGSLEAIPGGALFASNELAPLALLFTTTSSCRQEVVKDWYSPTYGRSEISPTFRARAFTRLPAEFATMLIPGSELAAHLGILQPIECEQGSLTVKGFRYSTADADDYIFFNDGEESWRIEPWASDAKFLFCSTDPKKSVRQFVICGGSYFDLNDRRIFDARRSVKYCEWVRDENAWQAGPPAYSSMNCRSAASRAS